jgi:hypothetical protein
MFSRANMSRRRAWPIVVAVLALSAAWLIARRHIPSSLDYRGEKIKLTKFYLSFEDYKNDPDNIDSSEDARVQRLVAEAPIGRRFKDLNEAVSAVFAVKFPGYGSGGFGTRKADGDGTLSAFEIEIPRSGRSRFFVFRCAADGCALIDDFVPSGSEVIADFHRDGPNLVYTTASGGRPITRPTMKPR